MHRTYREQLLLLKIEEFHRYRFVGWSIISMLVIGFLKILEVNKIDAPIRNR